MKALMMFMGTERDSDFGFPVMLVWLQVEL